MGLRKKVKALLKVKDSSGSGLYNFLSKLYILALLVIVFLLVLISLQGDEGWISVHFFSQF